MQPLPDEPRIAVVGTGAIGGYYGGLLAHAGYDVRFLLRSDYDQVCQHGLRLCLPENQILDLRVQAYSRSADIGPVDLVIVAAKATANPDLQEVLEPLLADHTAILTLQNGLGNVEYFGRLFGTERMFGGLCFICLNRISPGVIENYYPGYISLGAHLDSGIDILSQICNWFDNAGVNPKKSASLGEALWRKLFWNIPFNGLAIAGGDITTDKILESPDLASLARTLMEEVQMAAAAWGYAIPDDFIERQFRVTGPMGAYKPSSLIDYRQGRIVEVEAIWGEPLRQGQDKGVDMPHLETLYWLLKALCK